MKLLASAAILALAAASIRAISLKEPPKAFVSRLVVGVLLAGTLCYILRDMALDTFWSGSISFGAGWFGGEGGAMFARFTLSRGKELLEDYDKKNENGTDTDNQDS